MGDRHLKFYETRDNLLNAVIWHNWTIGAYRKRSLDLVSQ